MEKEEARKGPWTEREDGQLAFYVKLFGDRRWDFIAKVSGLKRTGKSCRLRWVNYLNPGLKRGKMTPHEERLVLELQAKWGNRWSRIARKLPGRTDNEIKNYWRTYLRKTAQEKKSKKATTHSSPPSSPSSPSSSSSSSNSSSESMFNVPIGDVIGPVKETNERTFYDTGGKKTHMPTASVEPDKNGLKTVEDGMKVYSMDEIWKDIEIYDESANGGFVSQSSPMWDFCTVFTDSLWCMDEEEQNKMLKQTANFYQFNPRFY